MEFILSGKEAIAVELEDKRFARRFTEAEVRSRGKVLKVKRGVEWGMGEWGMCAWGMGEWGGVGGEKGGELVSGGELQEAGGGVFGGEQEGQDQKGE